MGPLGWQETVLILIVALVVFGPRKLPELGKTLGKAMTEFRRASSELRTTWKREMDEIERETASVKQTAREVQREISSTLKAHVDDPESPYAHKQGPVRPASKTNTAAKKPSQPASATSGKPVSSSDGKAPGEGAPKDTVPTGVSTGSSEPSGASKPPDSEAATT